MTTRKKHTDYWMASRPKRSLNSIPEILTDVACHFVNSQWDTKAHENFEDMLQAQGLKREGDLRGRNDDMGGGGGRTYMALLRSLGLLFKGADRRLYLTIAGEAIVNGNSPVEVLRGQLFKFQYPSPYSDNIKLDKRFKIKPVTFLFQLLTDPSLGGYITEGEIADCVISEATSNTAAMVRKVAGYILKHRQSGKPGPKTAEAYDSGKLSRANARDVANTFVNWVEYTQLAKRDRVGKKDSPLRLMPGLEKLAAELTADSVAAGLIRLNDTVNFQRRYGLALGRVKDTRSLTGAGNISKELQAKRYIQKTLFEMSCTRPIVRVTPELVDEVAQRTGLTAQVVEDTLSHMEFTNGSLDRFMTEYIDMSRSGKEKAIAFEKATENLFRELFRLEAKHLGQTGETDPDVYVWSTAGSFAGIVDNKAMADFSISETFNHKMADIYIPKYTKMPPGISPLKFFLYIAASFGTNIDAQLRKISDATGIDGAAINAYNIIQYAKTYLQRPDEDNLLALFTGNRQIMQADFC